MNSETEKNELYRRIDTLERFVLNLNKRLSILEKWHKEELDAFQEWVEKTI